MTKNEAYLYAKRIYRQKLTHIELEKKMQAEGFNDEAIKMVKDRMAQWANGMTAY